MDAVAAKSYSEQYEQMLREQLEQALDSIDRQEQAQINRYDTELARVEAARQNALRGAYADYANNINPYGIQAEAAYANGLRGAGKSETALANYYNTYQNMLAQIHSLKDEQASDLRLDLDDALAQNEASRTAARGDAYNSILNERIRREESEYNRAQDEREYAFRLAQAQQEQENWQKEFELKLAAAQKSSAKSGGSGSGRSASAAQSSVTDGAGGMDEQQFEELYNTMNSLRWSVLPGESNPTPRIREWQSSYLQSFSKYLSPAQYQQLVALCL